MEAGLLESRHLILLFFINTTTKVYFYTFVVFCVSEKNNQRKDLIFMELRKIIYSALCLTLCMVLPFLTGQIPEIGNLLSPMHIPVLICGFICGWKYGLAVGFVAPLLRFYMFGMPPLIPMGISMAFELAAYGAITGILYKKLPKTNLSIYFSLISAMLVGRIIWGITRTLLLSVSEIPFTFAIFIADGFVKAVPGIILHIIVVPVVVMAFRKNGLLLNE